MDPEDKDPVKERVLIDHDEDPNVFFARIISTWIEKWILSAVELLLGDLVHCWVTPT